MWLFASGLLHWPPTYESVIVWGALAAIILTVGAVATWGRSGASWLRRRVERRLLTRLPRDTMRVVEAPGTLRWNDATIAGQPGTQVGGTWLVTNPMVGSKLQLVVADTELELPLWRRPRLDRQLSEVRSRLPLSVPWGGTGEMHAVFWIVPRMTKPGRDLRASIVLTDQFENRRRIKAIFRAPRPAPPTDEREREQLSAIDDPIEKGVAAVLQAELARYRTNGRREGGFGSVRISHGGRELRGGGDSRTVGSALNQIIVSDPENAEIASDNGDALIILHGSLDSDAERGKFFTALLDRVRRDSIYAPVAYLPLLVALSLDEAPRFFAVARNDLLGDADYGFSNCLMLLDSLLRLQHPDFEDGDLDEIEKFVHGTDEHPFAIPERLAAIRADRLRSG
jgi:hypothetical protein